MRRGGTRWMGGLGAMALCACAGCAPGETVDGPAWPEPETAPFDAGPTVDDDVGPRPTPIEDTPSVAPEDSGTPTPVDAGGPTPVDAGNPTPVDAGNPVPMDSGVTVPRDAGNPVSMDAGNPEPPVRACRVESTSFDAAMQELDVGPTSSTRLRFTLRGVPGPVVSAALRFDCHDCDHPGEEGYAYVGGRRFALPANTAWDNVTTHDLRIDVTGAVAAGDVTVEFGPGPLSRSFFRIGRVALEVGARVSSCPGGSAAPVDAGVVTGNRVTRTMGYAQATYSLRNNWVFRCDANYAYTARGSEHLTTDCPRLYRPDGTRRGTATWRFPAVVTGTYDVLITARHSVNRNPAGALFIVNGVSRRVPQNNELGGLNLHTSTWGRTTLSGDVVVVLDSNNPESDSVSSVTLRPAP